MPDEPQVEVEDFNDTFVMAEGRRLHFNCDGANHYYYTIDKSARKPNGQSYSRNRIYGGTIESARTEFPAETRVWETIIHPQNSPNCKFGRGAKGVGSPAGQPQAVRVVRRDAESSLHER